MQINDNMAMCSGCTACVDSCPQSAIYMKENDRGFLYPVVDGAKCTGCGNCRRVCPVNRDGKAAGTLEGGRRILGLRMLDREKMSQSQSGGAFTLFAEYVLEQGGVVYGAGLDDDLACRYQRAEDVKGLEKLKGSKYVQAEVGNIFSRVRSDLQTGRKVLFGGTACHVSGLLSFLGKEETERLITCDLVCHGVPSPLIYREYLEYLERKNKGSLAAFDFRSKASGWHSHIEKYRFKDGREILSVKYKNLFYSNLCLRESCYGCYYVKDNRAADITVGDFWGIEKIRPDWGDNKGVSLVMLNTIKGRELFWGIFNKVEYTECSAGDCLQHNLLYPTAKPEGVDSFWKQYRKRGFSYILKMYSGDETAEEGNCIALNNWLTMLNCGKSISEYFTKRGINRLGVCGLPKNNRLLISELARSIVKPEFVYDIFDEMDNEAYDGITIIKEGLLSKNDIDRVDGIVITDEQRFVDALTELVQKGAPVYKVIPINFATALEI